MAAQQPAQRAAKAAAVFDPTGYWVPLITEDWRFRMVTPPKGDYASVPLNAEGRRVSDTWDLAKDDAAGLQCKAYGIGGIARQPGRLHITWQDDNTLKLEYDAGQQTRLLHFAAAPPSAEKTWQGASVAEWDVPAAGGRGPGGGGGGGGFGGGGGQAAAAGGPGAGTPPGGAAAGGAQGGRGRGAAAGAARGGADVKRPGAIKVVTTGFREGYMRKNGVPYSENAVVTEYIDRLGPEPNGAVYLLIRMTIDDPKYLQQPFITSTHYRLEPDGAAKWNPAACKTEPPGKVGK